MIVIGDAFLGFFAGTLVLGIIVLVLLWRPILGPWMQERQGLADLRQDQQSRQVLIEQASAETEAALERAEATRFIGEAAQRYPESRRQEFIGVFAEALVHGRIDQIIYVPTVANIPILKAPRLSLE